MTYQLAVVVVEIKFNRTFLLLAFESVDRLYRRCDVLSAFATVSFFSFNLAVDLFDGILQSFNIFAAHPGHTG